MTDADAIETLFRTVTSAIRTVSLRDALGTLRGLLLLAEDRPEVQPIQSLYSTLCQVDDQLELIASGQLKLPLNDPQPPLPPPTKPSRDGRDGDLPPHGPHGETDLP